MIWGIYSNPPLNSGAGTRIKMMYAHDTVQWARTLVRSFPVN